MPWTTLAARTWAASPTAARRRQQGSYLKRDSTSVNRRLQLMLQLHFPHPRRTMANRGLRRVRPSCDHRRSAARQVVRLSAAVGAGFLCEKHRMCVVCSILADGM